MCWSPNSVRPDLELAAPLVLPAPPDAAAASAAAVAYLPWICRKHMLVSDQLILLPAAAARGGGFPPPSRLAAIYEPLTLRRYTSDASAPSSSLYPERLAWRALEGLELRPLDGGASKLSLLAEPPADAHSTKRVLRRDPYGKLRADFPGCFS